MIQTEQIKVCRDESLEDSATRTTTTKKISAGIYPFQIKANFYIKLKAICFQLSKKNRKWHNVRTWLCFSLSKLLKHMLNFCYKKTASYTRKVLSLFVFSHSYYWAIQRSWFARVNAFCNLSAKKSREVTAHFRANFWVGVASRCV